jgi:hypothetical protein
MGQALSVSKPIISSRSGEISHPHADPVFGPYEIDAECKVVEDPYSLERKLWDKLDPA